MDLVDLKAERREEGRCLRREDRDSRWARVGGGGNIGASGNWEIGSDLGVAQERWRWSRRVRRHVIKVSRR